MPLHRADPDDAYDEPPCTGRCARRRWWQTRQCCPGQRTECPRQEAPEEGPPEDGAPRYAPR